MRGPQGATTVRHPIFRWSFMGLLLLGTLLGSVEATQGGELSHDLSPRVATLAEEIAAARHAETPEFAARMGVPLGDLKEFTNSLLTLRNLYLLFPTELRRRDDAARQLAAWEQNPPAAAPEVPPPYGMAFYDRTWDRRDEIVRRVEEGNFDRRSIRGDLEAQANARDVSRRQLRRIEDRLREVSLPEEERRKLEWQQRRLLLDQEGDNAFVELLNIRDNALRLEGERLSRELALLEERLDVIRNHLEFREEDRHQDMESLGDQAAAMAARGQQYDRRFETFQGAALRARDPGAFPGIAEEQALRELGAEACQRLRDQCRLMEEVLREQQVTRERRYTLPSSPPDAPTLAAWKKDWESWKSYGASSLPLRHQWLLSLENRIATLRNEMGDLTDAGLRHSIEQEMTSLLQETRDTTRESETLFSSLLREQRRLEEDATRNQEEKPFTDQISELLGAEGDALWNAELWVIEDRPVTVAKVLKALGILVVGFFLVRAISRFLGDRLSRHLNLDLHAVALVRKISFYVLAFAVVLFALNKVNIPLTAFAFLGGALAIGVGVGAQSFFSNLISGVLLMVEKPLRIHDIVEVGGELAVVREIGARATRVTTFDSTDIFLPNSSFWGNQIANQTYGSSSLKLSLAIGVAYGSPEREVERLLRQIAEAHPRILKTPAPYVRLAQFGETAMVFRLAFYLAQKEVVISPRLANDTLSDLRYAAVEAFRHVGIGVVPTRRLDLVRPPEHLEA